MRKKELADLHEMSSDTLRKLLNEKYFEVLEPLGYEKNSKKLPPIVVREFTRIWGKKLQADEV